jgi:hypothetical protein
LDITEHFNPAVTLLLSATGQQYVTTDIYIPELKLAFEYQGEHHFQETSMSVIPDDICQTMSCYSSCHMHVV